MCVRKKNINEFVLDHISVCYFLCKRLSLQVNVLLGHFMKFIEFHHIFYCLTLILIIFVSSYTIMLISSILPASQNMGIDISLTGFTCELRSNLLNRSKHQLRGSFFLPMFRLVALFSGITISMLFGVILFPFNNFSY